MFPVKFTGKDIESIHDKTLWVLENIGVSFQCDSAIETFKKHGAKVDGDTVFISEKLLSEALKTTVSSFRVNGLKKSVTIGDGKPGIASASCGVFVLKDGQIYDPLVEDYINNIKLDETSSVVDFINCQQIYTKDLVQENAAAVKTALTLKYATKPIIAYCGSYNEAVQSLEIARDFFEGQYEYYAMGVGNMVSPFRYTRESIGAIQAYAEFSQPICLTCCSGLGTTSPITIGGTLVQNNAEILAGIVYGQLLNPGLPMIYGNLSTGTDMRKASASSGSIEALAIIPFVKSLAKYYGLPSRAGGSLNDAKQIDYQAGAESALGIGTAIYNEIDFIMHSAGEFNSFNTYSMEKQVMDEEIIEQFLFIKNLDMDSDEAIDLQTIKNVGSQGSYLMEEQTMEKFRTAQFTPKIANRDFYSSWENEGRQSLYAKAQIEVKRRIENYKMPELNIHQQKVLETILSKLHR